MSIRLIRWYPAYEWTYPVGFRPSEGLGRFTFVIVGLWVWYFTVVYRVLFFTLVVPNLNQHATVGYVTDTNVFFNDREQ
jgi:hypothetical protein